MMFSVTMTLILLALAMLLLRQRQPRLEAERVSACPGRAACPYAERCDGRHCLRA